MIYGIALVVLVAASALIISRTRVHVIIVKDETMSAALDRLTASVNAAVARIESAQPSDDAQLNALADQLDAAVSGANSNGGAPEPQPTQSLNG
jgi:hypothetical protein